MIRRVQKRWWPSLAMGLLLVPAIAQAQDRGFAGGLGAVTFGTVRGSDLAARAGARLSDHVFVFGESGRMASVLPTADQQALNDAASAVAETMGGVPAVIGHLSSVYGIGAVRVTTSARKKIAPYAEAGVGFAHLHNGVTATVDATDITAQVLTPLLSAPSQTDPLLSLGGGVSVQAGRRSAVDIGYRYSRIFTTAEPINTGKLYAGIRLGL